MPEDTLHRQNIVACIWDFDKTLIPGYMQGPIFRHFNIDEKRFWREVNALPAIYRKRGQFVSPDILYLNHLLTYVRAGLLPGLNNKMLRRFGRELDFYQGLPEFFEILKSIPARDPRYARYEIKVEHYVISTGIAEMVRGSAIAPFVENVYGCEFIENPLPPHFEMQKEFEMEAEAEIGQIGQVVDNTAKTRFIFEINKGTNKIDTIDVNSRIAPEDRRVPIQNMIYVADGPSDVPVFSVVRKHGGQTYAVYEPKNEKEFAQNDELRRSGRVDHFGRADYREKSDTFMWLTSHVRQICERIAEESEQALLRRVRRPPQHIHKEDPPIGPREEQPELFGEAEKA
ncbi:MAG: haloacid dehalogenase-like hydrolase [Opitutales bacterium]|nr:haloacid dehalogenase-like hydrolase [Opitutales bacterium]